MRHKGTVEDEAPLGKLWLNAIIIYPVTQVRGLRVHPRFCPSPSCPISISHHVWENLPSPSPLNPFIPIVSFTAVPNFRFFHLILLQWPTACFQPCPFPPTLDCQSEWFFTKEASVLQETILDFPLHSPTPNFQKILLFLWKNLQHSALYYS